MKRNVMFKRVLPMLLFVLGLCVTSTTYAQDATITSPAQDDAVSFVNEATASLNIMEEMVALKSSVQSLTPGSAAYVDAVRRVEVFGKGLSVLQAGETVQAAYAASINHLYRGIDAKAAEIPILAEIEQTLATLIIN